MILIDANALVLLIIGLIDQNLVSKHKRTSTERYLTSKLGVSSAYFVSDGLTDSLLIELGKECDLFITGDSSLSNIAIANGIKVYDIVQRRNENLRK